MAEKEIEKREKEIKRLKEKFDKKQLQTEKFKDNNVAFVSFETVFQKEEILLNREKYKMWLFRICQKKSSYKIMRAPKPSNVVWKNIGYTRSIRMKGTYLGIVMIIATLPFFALFMLILEYGIQRVRAFMKKIPVAGAVVLFLFIPICIGIALAISSALLGKINKISRYLNKRRFLLSTTVILIIINFIYFVVNQAVVIQHEWVTKQRPNKDLLFKIMREKSYEFFFTFSFVVPFFRLIVLDIPYYLKKKLRRDAVKALKSKPKFSTSYHFLNQKELNKVTERFTMGVEGLYSGLLAIYSLIIAFCFMVRPAPLLGLGLLLTTSLVNKYKILRRYNPPKGKNLEFLEGIATFTAVWVPRVYTIARISYHYTLPEYRNMMNMSYHVGNVVILIAVFSPFHNIVEMYLEKEFEREEKIKLKKVRETFMGDLMKSLVGDDKEKLRFKHARNFTFDEVKDYLGDDYAVLNPSEELKEGDYGFEGVSFCIEEEEDEGDEYGF